MTSGRGADSPDASILKEIEAHAVVIAREAGRILLEHFHQPIEVKFKGKNNQDPVTIADSRSEEYLKTAIRERFPQHGILSEEGGALHEPDAPFLWVLDPLDGTVNFMNGLPIFSVSIGVLWRGRPRVGAIYVPVGHRATPGVYHARPGGGVNLDGEKLGPARAPSGRPLAQFPSHYRLAGRSRKVPQEARNLGSTAAEFALTATGVLQYALAGGPHIWDIAAGLVLVSEAGGLALTRPKGRGKWLPLESFSPGPEKEASLEDLRQWSAPVIAGDPETVRRVVKDIRYRYRLARFFGRLRPHGKRPA